METGRPSRKLAIILHADVVGSTLLVQKDETLSHERIRSTFDLLSEVTKKQQGTVQELRGDALVAEFALASDAVEAALTFQESNTEFLKKLEDEIRPEVRIGIAMGEVVIADKTVTGEAVILAQRLEQVAPSGGVCIQATARETIPKRLPFRFDNLDGLSLKGFDEPIKAFMVARLIGDGASVASQTTSREPIKLDPPAKPSIAVLSFDNMSGDPEQEYFSEGITEDIVTALSRVSGMMVVAHSSTLGYKGKIVDVKQIGREQGVRYVLEGSLRKAGNRVRVSCQLVDTVTGMHKYADSFDRELDDIFEVQDEITRQVTVELQVQLTSGEQARLWAGGTDSVAAWEKALKADDLMGRHIREENHEARAVAQGAIDLDPNYAAAWTTLGMTHWEDARWGWSDSRDTSLDHAEFAASQAQQIDINYPGVFTLWGLIHLSKGQHDKSIEMMEQAVALAPSHAASVALYGLSLHLSIRPDECIRQMKRAMRLSPIFPYWYDIPIAGAHLLKGEPQYAREILKQAIEREPDSNLPRIWLAIALVELAQLDESKKQAQCILDRDPSFSVHAWSSGIEFRDNSWNRKLEQNLRNAGLPD
jgi:adenylate cyclase